jgi:hypothetical protein
MAQWNGQYGGLTDETKVQDLEESLRRAVTAFAAAADADRESKGKAVHHLSDRLLAARLKALRARLSALREPGTKRASDSQIRDLQRRKEDSTHQALPAFFASSVSLPDSGGEG